MDYMFVIKIILFSSVTMISVIGYLLKDNIWITKN